jgi:predicted peroxiredoxin
LFVGTHGTDDPTRATFPFQEPRGVVEAGHETGIMLLGEATRLIKGDVARTVQGVGTPPLEELIDWLFARGVRISI